MYAAAGGASLASRQARQKQRQQKKLQLQAKLHPPKPTAASLAEQAASTPTPVQSRQFHQLPTNYLRTPQAQARKLSASYTAQSKLLLPIDEGDTQSIINLRMHSHAHPGLHSHSHVHSHAHPLAHGRHSYTQQQPLPLQHYQQQLQQQHTYGYHSHGRVSPKLVHRHSGSSGTSFHQSQLPKSATATLPLVAQAVDADADVAAIADATPPTTPSGAAVAIKTASASATPAATVGTPSTCYVDKEAIALPQLHDAIIVTPATPMASPGHVAKLRAADLSQAEAAERQPLTAAEHVDVDDDHDHDDDDEHEPMQPPTGPLERKCSVYRMRRSDAFEHDMVAGAGSSVKRQLRELQFNYQQQQQYEPLLTDEPQLLFKGRKLQVCAYCEEGICVCEHLECAQGRAAWLERSRRCSVQEASQQAQAASHLRWVKRNRIQDASLGGSSDDEDFLGVLRGPSTFANAFLYVGLGTVALGLVIAFVGTGEKGFKTVELRLIGPSLIGLGLICCILRILFCICPSHCIASSKKSRKKNGNKVDADHTTSLLRGESKRVSIARSSSMQPKYPITHKRSQSKMLNEGMEALRQIATTSLFMQNEQKPSMNRVVPIIKEPENQTESSLEMKKFDAPIQVREVGYRDDNKNKIIAQTNITTTKNAATTATTTGSSTAVNAQAITSPTATDPSSTSTPTTNSSSSLSNQTIFKATTTTTSAIKRETPTTTDRTTTTTTTTMIPPPQGTVTNSVGKLTRQRVVFNEDEKLQRQQQQQQRQQKQPIFDQSQSLSSSSAIKDAVEEDLLMETSLSTRVDGAPSLFARPNDDDNDNSMMTSKSLTFQMPTATVFNATPFYATSSGLGSASNYDLPPAMPHSYAAAASFYSRIGTADRETLIRGPLGMTASPSTYTLPSSASATPVTTPSTSAATNTEICLLPCPSSHRPTTSTTIIDQMHAQQQIPGQVLHTAPSTSGHSRLGASIRPTPGLTMPMPMTGMTLFQKTSTPISYNFPAPLSSSSASSASSSGRKVVNTAATATATATLAPPQTTTSANNFEPELLLSPAKLGQ